VVPVEGSEPDIILASQSPRRRELLQRIVAEFRVIPSSVDEERFREKDPLRFALRAAEAKARDVGEKHPSSLVIAADTVVSLGERIFGKPRDRADAEWILGQLSGQKHRVITAVAVFRKEEERLLTGYEISHVAFRPLSSEAIDRYLDTCEYLDKAGSYAVQEVGDAFIETLQGDYDNVVGLPVKRVRKLLAEFAKPEPVVAIVDIAFPHDWGVGRIGGKVIFVPGAVVGDTVRIAVTRTKRRHRFGRLLALTEPSPHRVTPECPHFGSCGGCAFQDLSYTKQVELKENYLFRTVEKIGGVDLDAVEKEPFTPSPSIFFYRNKMEYAFGGQDDKIYLGLRKRASPLERYRKQTAPLRRCSIFSRAIEEIFPGFIEFAESTGYAAYDPISRTGYFRNLVLREGKSAGEILAVLVTRSGGELNPARLAERIGSAAPQIQSLWWVEKDRVSDVVDYKEKRQVFGPAFIKDAVGGLKFRIYPESFFQPNPKGAEILYGRIVEEARRRQVRRVLGLYCGPGSIEISLARAADEVTGIDSEAVNIAAAEENCRLNLVHNCRFIRGRVEDILKSQTFRDYDLLILDPPRAGISAKGMKQVLNLNIPTVFYISCNPAAFARDVGCLQEKGYRLQKLAGFDFFPHTPHLECLGILTK
jgi:23S rRNA (uracil1939-C5)-methyltransferase